MQQAEVSYSQLFKEIKAQIEVAQIKTVAAANQQMLLLYWQLGIFILQNQEREGWGSKIVDRLSSDLTKEFPKIKGFSVRNLKYMRKFAESLTPQVLKAMTEAQAALKLDIGATKKVVAKIKRIGKKSQEMILLADPVGDQVRFLNAIPSLLTWSHHIVLMDKVEELGKRFWYMLSAIENGMSRNILSFQIDNGLYERQVITKKITNFTRTLPAPHTDFAEYMLKDPMIFDFVQAKDKADERDVERQLAEHITKFLLELGQGFAFVGRQVHFSLGGSDFYVDLLFYHLVLRAYFVIDLKVREFEPEDTGKLGFYMTLVNEKLKRPGDNDTIGLVLCKSKNNVIAEYALRNTTQPMGVTEYQFSKVIPDPLKSQLPGLEDFEGELLESES